VRLRADCARLDQARRADEFPCAIRHENLDPARRRRIDVNQLNRFIVHLPPQDVEAGAVRGLQGGSARPSDVECYRPRAGRGNWKHSSLLSLGRRRSRRTGRSDWSDETPDRGWKRWTADGADCTDSHASIRVIRDIRGSKSGGLLHRTQALRHLTWRGECRNPSTWNTRKSCTMGSRLMMCC
jgi:hypothetical protein